MLGIRKSLDLFFTRRELKILDDVMPDTIKRAQEDEESLGEEHQGNDNLQIPLANGNVIKIPLSSINISEEVNKTGIWKQVNNEKSEKKKSPGKKMKVMKRGKQKDAITDEEKARLSTMAEEEEGEDGPGGLTIKVAVPDPPKIDTVRTTTEIRVSGDKDTPGVQL